MELEDFHQITKPLPEAMYVISSRGEIIAANPAATGMLGLGRQALYGRKLADWVTDSPDKVSNYLRACARSGQFVLGALIWRGAEHRLIDCRCEGVLMQSQVGGQEKSVLLRCTPRIESTAKFAELNRDLEALQLAHRKLEQRRTELELHVQERTAALAASETRIHAIVEAAADGIITCDAAGIVESFNPAAERIFGYAVDQMIGRDVNTLILESRCEESGQAWQGLIGAGEAAGSGAYQGTGRRKDGSGFDMELTASRMDVAGRSISIGIVRDVSERKRIEAMMAESAVELARYAGELERSNKELDQFAYVASHDLKAPLRAIANLSQWIEEDLEDKLDGDTRKQMNLLRGRVHRMEALVEGILQYSRIGRVAVEPELVVSRALVAEVLENLAPPEGFTVTVAPNMPTLNAPRLLLSQVFTNLIGNAIKYHDRPDGNVQVSVRTDGDFHVFTVADDGPGIAPEYHQRIFTIFQTLEARDKVESTGIGLTIVLKIIEEQGGTISLDSELGKGAAFHFTWPIQPQPEVSTCLISRLG